MRLLLDTHAFLWWLGDDPRLSSRAREVVAEGDTVAHVSAATIWEAGIKARLGRLDLGAADLAVEIHDGGFDELPISAAHAQQAAGLPLHHRDPFDRMLVAQAQAEQLVLITADAAISHYEVVTLW